MGTTLTVCYTTGPELFILHAGDSRAYLYRDGALRRLTRAHTAAKKVIGDGMAEPEFDTETSQRHVLTNWIGGGRVEAEVAHHRLADGDRLLLCTDGLTNLVPEEEIAALLNAQSRPHDACRGLVDRALDYGGLDKVTVVLADSAIPEVTDTADQPARPG